MEIIEDRFAKKSIIIGSQLPLEKWYDIITEKTVADAILDRLLNASHKITLKGDSLRRKNGSPVKVCVCKKKKYLCLKILHTCHPTNISKL